MNISTKILWMALALFTINTAWAKPTIKIENVVHPSCSGGDGEIMISVIGGTPPYTYSWSTGDSTDHITGVSEGEVILLVTDDDGETASYVIAMETSGNLNLGATITDASHCNASDGIITTNVSGGSGNYDYFWNTGSTNSMVNNLSPGSYCVTVTEGSCTKTKCYTVEKQHVLSISGTTVNESAAHMGDGAVDISVSGVYGGTTTYSWDNGASTQDISNISAGDYCVTVNDLSNCPKSKCFSITDLNFSISNVVDIMCHGDENGRIDITPGGGTPPYNFSWSNGMSSEDLDNLSAGTYTCIITDSEGNSNSSTVVVDEVHAISVVVKKKNEKSDNSTDGSLDITVDGGTPPYTYVWSTGSSSEDIADLSFGNYCVTITDDNNCSKIICEFINTVNGITVDIDDKGVQTPTSIKESQHYDFLSTSDVEKYDVNKFNKQQGAVLKNDKDIDNMDRPTIYPNPASSNLNIATKDLGISGPLKIQLFTLNGSLLHGEILTDIVENTIQLDVTGIPDGVYLIQLTSEGGWYNERVIVSH